MKKHYGELLSGESVNRKNSFAYSPIHLFAIYIIFAFLSFPACVHAFMSDTEIAVFQKEIADKPVGERIALWTEKFVGTPYDPDPLGEYVTKKAIVADERVDCMYLSFRAVELALSLTPDKAIDMALDKRFITKGRLDSKGNVINYEDRFQYGEDMLDSGRWGEEITEQLGKATEIKGSRGKGKVKMVSKKDFLKSIKDSGTLKSGDFIFFIKAVEKRRAGEIVGHIGIVKIENRGVYLIHAGGFKKKGGEVKKVRLYDYINSMPFIGVRVSRIN
ncbi:MAG: hypothetical protein A2X54_03505 [Nitrospirae bacterium GWF2_44_13]|nr:MAG: hypothetical protein A2X54_03505 [Nitrospirae bacterium GWF2_44_13]